MHKRFRPGDKNPGGSSLMAAGIAVAIRSRGIAGAVISSRTTCTRSTSVVLWALWATVALSSGCANFAQVDRDVFRSAQPTGAEIVRWQREHGIRSVLNLRGASARRVDYIVEAAVCGAMGIELYNLSLSARRAPSDEEAAILADFLRKAPRPLLIHCKGGADRSGLAVAVYLITEKGWEPREAVDAGLTLRYGHIRLTHPELSEWVLETFE